MSGFDEVIRRRDASALWLGAGLLALGLAVYALLEKPDQLRT